MLARHADVIVRDLTDGTMLGWLKGRRSGYWDAWTADGRSVDWQQFTTMDQASDAVRQIMKDRLSS